MSELMAIASEKLVGFLSWMYVLIGCVLGFIIINHFHPYDSSFFLKLIGICGGGIVGFIIGTITLAPLVLLVSLRNKISDLESKLNKTETSRIQDSPYRASIKDGKHWTCGSCGEINPENSNYCRSCGKYK